MAAHRVILLKFGTEVLTGSPELLMIKAESDWTNDLKWQCSTNSHFILFFVFCVTFVYINETLQYK